MTLSERHNVWSKYEALSMRNLALLSSQTMEKNLQVLQSCTLLPQKLSPCGHNWQVLLVSCNGPWLPWSTVAVTLSSMYLGCSIKTQSTPNHFKLHLIVLSAPLFFLFKPILALPISTIVQIQHASILKFPLLNKLLYVLI